MRPRTVVGFERIGDRYYMKLEDAPVDIAGMGESFEADVTTPDGPTALERGDTLFQRLGKHQPVRDGLTFALGRQIGEPPGPVYFHIGTPLADPLPWEEIYAQPVGFVALDVRTPVGRIAGRRRHLKDREFAPPLRVVAVLSAAKNSGVSQLAALTRAVTSDAARATGMTLHVITGEPAVLAEVERLADPTVTGEWIGDNTDTLQKQIAARRPQLLHLLCHGGVAAGMRRLSFATRGDWLAGESDTGSVRLTTRHVADATLPVDPWLVVLNACATAESAGDPALAHELVSLGIPAVVGMRRLVDITAANRFADLLYSAVVQTLAEVLSNQDARVCVIDWACALTAPRLGLSGADPGAVDVWADPVLYVQHDPLRVEVPHPGVTPAAAPAAPLPSEAAHLQGVVDYLEEYLAKVGPASSARQSIEELLADARRKLSRVSR